MISPAPNLLGRVSPRSLTRSSIANAARLYSSTSASTVPLVYDLHEPPKPIADQKTSPILFMHGLFGSKKNNRSISK
jgi:hypothetical protein